MTKTEDESKPMRQRNGGRRAYATSKITQQSDAAQKHPVCFACQARHKLHDCAEFQSWDVPRRFGFCKRERICFRCLSGKHRGVMCRTFPGCDADGCGGSHHSLLHATRQEQQQQQYTARREQAAQWQNPTEVKEFYPSNQLRGNRDTSVSNGASRSQANPSSSYSTATSEPETQRGKIAFQTAPVTLKYGSRSVTLNALLDPCSDASFITKAAANELDFEGEEQELQLGTVNGKEDVTMKTGIVKLMSLHSSYESSVNVHVISSLDGASVRTDWNTVKKQWPHLKSVPFPRMNSKNVDILIGLCAETTQLFVPLKTVKGADSDPVAVLTPLGWTAFGSIEDKQDKHYSSDLKMKKNMTDFSKTLRTHISKKACEEELEAIRAMTDLEVIQIRRSEESLMSREEQEALKKVSQSLSYNGDRYQAAVPWKDKEPQLVSNYAAAMQRLVRLEHSLKRIGGDLPARYGEILEEYVKKGYMTKTPVSEKTNTGEKEWFLPHFPVIREEKSST